MNHEIASCLADIKQAINEINEFLPEKKNFFEFQQDKKTKRGHAPVLERFFSLISTIEFVV